MTPKLAVTVMTALLLAACADDPAPYVQTKGGADVPAEKGRTERLTFDDADVLTKFESILGTWVVEPAGVLKQTETNFISPDYPRIVMRDTTYTNVRAKVRCSMHTGDIDRACGLMFRFQDSDNYYVTRANAKENNVRLYRVKNGSREQFGPDGKTPVPADQWHTLEAKAQGNTIEIFWNGAQIISATDDTFAKGKVGLWTKADSLTSFDDFEATEL